MDIFNIFKLKIIDVIKKLPLKYNDYLEELSFQVNVPKVEKFGDLTTNVALVLSKKLGINSLELAQSIADKLLVSEKNIITDIDIIKPGFINISLNNNFLYEVLNSILKNDPKTSVATEYRNAKDNKVNIEYVSANPTGPLHIGHGRGAIIGDVLANLYNFFGYNVTKEYYINDAGNQIVSLANSVYYRYCEKLNYPIEKPRDFYPGDYIIPIVKGIINQDGDKWLKVDKQSTLSYFGDIAVNAMMKLIKEDLTLLGVKYNIFSSEKQLANKESYNKLKDFLKTKDLIYIGTLEPPKGVKAGERGEDNSSHPALLFRTSNYGDSSDRVIEKADGTKTYFANDIVYHYDKLKRGFNFLIDILGVDHKGYEKRLLSAVEALSTNQAKLKIIFTEMVNLVKDKKLVKMSKRGGEFITLKEVLDEVPKDAFRIMMISRSNNSPLDFDLSTIKEKSEKNPVYYIQYAYARIYSVFKNAKEIFPDFTPEKLINSDKKLLTHTNEILVIKELSSYIKMLKTALKSNNVHLIYLLLINLAKSTHILWSAGKIDPNLRFIIESNKNLTFARLSLLLAMQKIMFTLFNLVGIEKPIHM